MRIKEKHTESLHRYASKLHEVLSTNGRLAKITLLLHLRHGQQPH
jgi:hypothetical protein